MELRPNKRKKTSYYGNSAKFNGSVTWVKTATTMAVLQMKYRRQRQK